MLGLNLCGSLGFSLMLTTLEPQERTKGKGIAPAYLSPPPCFFKERKIFSTAPSHLYIPCQENSTHWALCHMFPIPSCKESWESMDLAFESFVVGGGKGEGCRERIWGQTGSVC